MLSVGNGQGILEAFLVNEVREDERRTTPFHDVGQVFQSQPDIGTPAFCMEINQFTDDVQDMLASFLGRNELLNPVREKDNTNLIVVLYG